MIRVLFKSKSKWGFFCYSALVPDLHAPSMRAGVKDPWLCGQLKASESSTSSISDAWPGFSTPPKAPSVSPTGQFLASLTLLHPQLLSHKALVEPPPACSTIPSSHLWFHPMLLRLTACMPGSWAWKSSSAQTWVKSTLSSCDPCLCSTNIWRTARASESASLSTWIVFELILGHVFCDTCYHFISGWSQYSMAGVMDKIPLHVDYCRFFLQHNWCANIKTAYF